jgi:hypothetical protein
LYIFYINHNLFCDWLKFKSTKYFSTPEFKIAFFVCVFWAACGLFDFVWSLQAAQQCSFLKPPGLELRQCWFAIFRLPHRRKMRIIHSRMSPRIFGFAICGFKKKVYMPTFVSTICVSTCTYCRVFRGGESLDTGQQSLKLDKLSPGFFLEYVQEIYFCQSVLEFLNNLWGLGNE